MKYKSINDFFIDIKVIKKEFTMLIGFVIMFVSGLVLGMAADDPFGFLKDLGF